MSLLINLMCSWWRILQSAACFLQFCLFLVQNHQITLNKVTLWYFFGAFWSQFFYELCSSVRSTDMKKYKGLSPETLELLLTRLNIRLIALVSHELMLQRNALSLWVWVWSSWSFILTIDDHHSLIPHVSVWAARPVTFWPADSLIMCELEEGGGRSRFTSLFISGRRLERGFSQTRGGLNTHIQCHCDWFRESVLKNHQTWEITRDFQLLWGKMTSNYTKCARKLILSN